MSDNTFGCSSIFNFAISSIFPPIVFKRKLAITQDDRNPIGRNKDLARMHAKYIWTREGGIGTTPMVTRPPQPEERIRIAWLTRLLGVLNKISDNNARVDAVKSVDEEDHAENEKKLLDAQDGYIADTNEEVSIEEVNHLVSTLGSKITSPDAIGVGKSLDEYKEFYQAFQPPKVATYERFLSDELFGFYRIAGPSPMRLTILKDFKKKFPDLPSSIMDGVKLFDTDSLEEAQKQDRLYYVEYSETTKIAPSSIKDGKYMYAPSAVFAVPKKGSYSQKLMPIAIKCGPEDSYPWYSANLNKTDPLTWIAAKVVVQTTDGFVHETIHHLARTHLLCGIIVCATRRNLAKRHPLFELIVSHSYGTLVINFAAAKALVNDGGVLDTVTAPQAAVMRQFTADSLTKERFNYNNAMPDVDLKDRGVMSSTLHFPYRDDALELWEAINEWVSSYVSAYYKTDEQVQKDDEIQKWAREITEEEKGGIGGFGDEKDGKISTIKYLVRAVSMFVFTASVQHAGVNFPQKPFMSYAPIMPLSGYVPPPKTPKTYKNFDELVEKMMPPLEEAYTLFQTQNILSGVSYTHLGEYDNLKMEKEEVKDAYKKFKSTLDKIEERITERNEEEKKNDLPQYAFLRPSLVPESINI